MPSVAAYQQNQYQALPQPVQPQLVVARGRIMGAICSVSKALADLILKVFNAFLSLFGPHRLKFYSIHDIEQPIVVPNIENQPPVNTFHFQSQPLKQMGSQNQTPFTTPVKPTYKEVKAKTSSPSTIRDQPIVDAEEIKFTDEEARAYLEKDEIKSEKNTKKMDQIARWVLDHIEDRLSKPFFTIFVQKKGSDLTNDKAYIQWVESLDHKQLSRFLELLAYNGANPPLFIHIKKELQLANSTGATNINVIGIRAKALFSTFTDKQATALVKNEDFWTLVSKFTTEAAENLKAETLGIFATNTEKHINLEKLISFLPEDQNLAGKLAAILPHATPTIEKVLRSKTERLQLFEYNDHEGTPVPLEERQAEKNKLSTQLKLRVKTPVKTNA